MNITSRSRGKSYSVNVSSLLYLNRTLMKWLISYFLAVAAAVISNDMCHNMPVLLRDHVALNGYLTRSTRRSLSQNHNPLGHT